MSASTSERGHWTPRIRGLILIKKLHAQFGYLKQAPKLTFGRQRVYTIERWSVFPAYSHSNRWVGVGGACSDKWIVTREIRRS